MDRLEEIIISWSVDRSIDKIKKFYETPLISDYLWKETDLFLQSKLRVKYLENENVYLVGYTDVEDCIFEKFYESFECNLSCDLVYCFDSFDNFCKLNRLIKVVNISKSAWHLSKCTCFKYFKEFICVVHIIFIAIKLKLTEINYDYMKIGLKAKRGRKKRATPALLKM